MSRFVLTALFVSLFVASAVTAQTREQKVRADKEKVEAKGFWIYNDLPKAFAAAKESGKPLVVALRCIPCVECVKLDDDLVDQDERLQAALDKFVRVRVVSANGLDLSLFQFDTDQSFAVFMLNADGTIYGRYGTRSDHAHWADDVSVEGLAKALEGALELHAEFPKNKTALAAKRGPKPEFAAPENYPTLKDKYGSQLNYESNVVQSCIHCHQIGDAQRQMVRDTSTVMPDKVLFPYPHPKSIGLILDPKERATVLRVEPGSLAAKAGFEAGDTFRTLAGQPILSMADVQWVLHHVPAEGGSLQTIVSRSVGPNLGPKPKLIKLELPANWRQQDDIAWRASSWELRRIGLGGLFLKDISAELREKQNLPAEGLALRVEHVGQYAPHNRAQQAGFKKEDVLISFDGRTDLARETDLLRYTLNDKKPGESVPVTVLREGKKVELTLPIGK
jgi:serine protease Do